MLLSLPDVSPVKRPAKARTAPLRRKPGAAKKTTRQSPAQSRRPAAAVKPAVPAPPPAPPEIRPTPRRPTFYDAIAIYESGVRALQRHDFEGAAEAFRQVLDRYPEERELLERARLYLRVCVRETAQRAAAPQSTPERVYAATVALNAGNSEVALAHVQRALDQEPASDHAHYIMAVVRSARSETDKALDHLRRAIELNPDNRSLASQDADLEVLRETAGFRSLMNAAPQAPRRQARIRR